MIYSVRGKLVLTQPNLAVVECGGLGYKCLTSLSSQRRMPKVGEEVTLFTYLYIREDVLDLYGFMDLSELNCFKMLLGVSGVGPKAALSILSDMSPERFALCVASGDSKSLTKAQGVGPKLAQRVVLELKDKIKGLEAAQGFIQKDIPLPEDASNLGEAISALVVLGYTQSEAAAALAKLDSSLPVEKLITGALRHLAGQK